VKVRAAKPEAEERLRDITLSTEVLSAGRN
jgi:hypothetical protein